jgi:hypothetical protein
LAHLPKVTSSAKGLARGGDGDGSDIRIGKVLFHPC